MSTPVGPYSPVVRAGDWIITSGQLGLQDGNLVEGGVPAETAQCIANIETLLAQHGATLTDVVKTLCFVRDLADFDVFNAAYVEAFGSHRPARSTVGAVDLARAANVEIEAWAYKPV